MIVNDICSEHVSIIVIGLGHQSLEDHIPAIRESDKLLLSGVVDIDGGKAKEIAYQEGVPYAEDVEQLLKKLDTTPKIALVAVPHSDYVPIIEQLTKMGIHIIKEKPFAASLQDARYLENLIKENDITLKVTLQRRFNPIFLSFKQLIKRIGKVHSIEARYTMNIQRLDEGWRANKVYSGGGALLDLGYHYIDLIVWYFGLPDSITCKLSTGNRDGQDYDVEDTAFVDFYYNDEGRDNERVLGSLIVSRVYPDKEEQLIAYGTKGSVAVMRGKLLRRDTEGREVECLERSGSWPSAIIDQLEEFVEQIQTGQQNGYIEQRYFDHLAFVQAAYDSASLQCAQNPNEVLRRSKEETTLV